MHAVWFTEPELELIEDALLERKHTDMELLVDEDDNPMLQPVRASTRARAGRKRFIMPS